jgi:Mrp family chromosome partitioning ATPase
MTNEVDIVIRKQERVPLDLMRASSSLPVAKMRGSQVRQSAHKELIKLIQRLFLSRSRNVQTVVFSGVEPGSGCTFICTRTAEILANHLEEPVCLVDANFRSSRINDQFEFENGPGGRRDDDTICMRVGVSYVKGQKSNLWLVVYRPATADCPSQASIERFESLIEDLRKDFTYILIDAPPLSDYTDAQLLAKTADGLVMVLGANDTRREAAQRVKETLDASDIPVLGAVLNKRTFPIPEFLYRRL